MKVITNNSPRPAGTSVYESPVGGVGVMTVEQLDEMFPDLNCHSMGIV